MDLLEKSITNRRRLIYLGVSHPKPIVKKK